MFTFAYKAEPISSFLLSTFPTIFDIAFFTSSLLALAKSSSYVPFRLIVAVGSFFNISAILSVIRFAAFFGVKVFPASSSLRYVSLKSLNFESLFKSRVSSALIKMFKGSTKFFPKASFIIMLN